MKRFRYVLLAAMTAAAFASCEHFDPIAPEEGTNEAATEPTYTIAQFVETFLSDSGDYHPVRIRSNGPTGSWLFSIDSIPIVGEEVIISGRVVSDDQAGNMYKSMVIQDVAHPEQALKLSVDAGNLSGLYPYGTLVSIRCNGLAIGKYAEQPQLCVATYNNNTNAMNADQKVGWAPGRIPFPMFQRAVSVVGQPNPAAVRVDTLSISEIESGAINDMCGRLVCVRGVHFNNKSQRSTTLSTTGTPDDNEDFACFAPTTNNIGYTQSRDVEDERGNYISVATSEYAKFARFLIPTADYSGDVVGIVGYYHDNALSSYKAGPTNWSITIRSLDDIHFADAQGNPWVPVEWSQDM